MEKTIRRLTKPSARHAFVEAEAVTAIAHQIRVLRQDRGLSQQQLARKLNTTQAAVSRLEDPSYGRLSVSTLLSLSHVFDVALQVRFVSTVRLLKETWKVKKEDLEVEPFEEEVKRVGFYGNLLKAHADLEAIRTVFPLGLQQSPPPVGTFVVTPSSRQLAYLDTSNVFSGDSATIKATESST